MGRLPSFVVSLLLMGSSLALAQDSTPVAAGNAPAVQTPMRKGGQHPRIKEIRGRMLEQFKRIHQGVKSKKLTQDEAKALRLRVDAVRDRMKSDIEQNGKKELTEEQVSQLNQMLDGDSSATGGGSASTDAASSDTTPAN